MITNIRTIAKYESKLLLRSWFFRIFAFLVILVLCGFNFGILLNKPAQWSIVAIASNIPYVNLLLLNVGQAVIAIFLASDFMKRENKMDTSEVFYVRPVSNAAYVLGKLWGNLRIFLIFNVVILGLVMLFNFIGDANIDATAYLIYLLIISLPTLIFIIGFSTFIMLLFKNQALTFIILLAYVGVTLFYIGEKIYYVFDYMTFNLPLFKSSIVGFTNLAVIVNHRSIYLFAGLGFICLTIAMFRRLSNTAHGKYLWFIPAAFCLFAGGSAVYKHIDMFRHAVEMRKLYTEINNVGKPDDGTTRADGFKADEQSV